MNDILSTRLDMIEAQLRRVQDFTDLDTKRLTALEELIDLLDNKIKQYVRSIDRVLTSTHEGLTDLKADAEMELGAGGDFCVSCEDITVSLATAINATESLKRDVRTAISAVIAGLNQRPKVQTSELSKISRDAFDRTSRAIWEEVAHVRDLVRAAHAADAQAKADKAAELWNAAWELYALKVLAPARALFADYTDFLLGLATRDSRLDNDICRLADELIRQWNPGVSLTIPAKYMALESTLARIVRLSFQDWSLWALPLVAREVGYVVNSRENTSERLGALIRKQAEEGMPETHLRDYLADVFATYAMGPAYCYAAIYMRFDPQRAYDTIDHHVPDAVRAEVIFATLDWMSCEKSTGDPYAGVIDMVREQWQIVLGQAIPPSAPVTSLDTSFFDSVKALAEIVFAERQAMFSAITWGRAMELRDGFLIGENRAQQTDDLRAVLNAAWLARVQEPAKSEMVERLAKAAFDVVSRRSTGVSTRSTTEAQRGAFRADDRLAGMQQERGIGGPR